MFSSSFSFLSIPFEYIHFLSNPSIAFESFHLVLKNKLIINSLLHFFIYPSEINKTIPRHIKKIHDIIILTYQNPRALDWIEVACVFERDYFASRQL